MVLPLQSRRKATVRASYITKQQRRWCSFWIALGLTLEQFWMGFVVLRRNQNHIHHNNDLYTNSTDNGMTIPPSIDGTSAFKLRRDWTQPKTPLSALAQELYLHQQHRSTHPSPQKVGLFRFRNRFGLGSDLHVWSQALCNSMPLQIPVLSTGDWIWSSGPALHSTTNAASTSPLSCYFPNVEPSVPSLLDETTYEYYNLTRGRGRVGFECREWLDHRNVTKHQFRVAAMELLFGTGISHQLQFEAERQLQHVFQNHHSSSIPSPLIAVHIRWGDKQDEMELVPISRYIQAVHELSSSTVPVNIFLATTDPRAVYEFVSQSPSTWNIYVDAYFQEYYDSAKSKSQDAFSSWSNRYNVQPQWAQQQQQQTKSAGLMALASLLVAMEAQDFVLTTASNWSRLLNELRLAFGPQNGTRMIDLRPGEW